MYNVVVTKENLETMVNRILPLILSKNKKYKDAWQRNDILTPLMRISEKLTRVEFLQDGRPALVPQEGVLQELVDVFSYSILAFLKYDANKKDQTGVGLTDADLGLEMETTSKKLPLQLSIIDREDRIKTIANLVMTENDD